MLTKSRHPSSELSHGECTNFLDAMDAVRRMVDYEISLFAGPENEVDRRSNDVLRAMRKAAIQASAEYRDAVRKVERGFFEKLAASDDEHLKEFGEAGLSGSYEGLAI